MKATFLITCITFALTTGCASTQTRQAQSDPTPSAGTREAREAARDASATARDMRSTINDLKSIFR